MMRSKTEAPGCFLKQKKSEKKPVYEKNMLNLKENKVLPSLVVIQSKSFDILIYSFFLALASKTKKNLYKRLSMTTVKKPWKIERRDC